MIHFTKGNMFDLDAEIRVNTVNCVGVMGAGVALAFKTRYPAMFDEYQRACSSGEVRPGEMHIWRSATEWVVNFPTKRHWREKSRYEDIEAGLVSLREYLRPFVGKKVALPALGCGNGGLDWKRVAPMIFSSLNDLEAEIFVFEPADSLDLGRKKNERSTNEVMHDLEALGFQSIDLALELAPESNLRAQVKGNAELLVNPWVAIYTSREIGLREQSALVSVANQMALLANPPTVAMIYQNSGTEEIAEILLANGLAVVLILPFSPRVKKRVGLSSDPTRRITYAILSFVDPLHEKASELDRSAEDVLRRGASVLLFSDPEPERYFRNKMKAFGGLPGFFLRYSTQSQESLARMDKLKFRPIGRNAETGEPNLTPIIHYHQMASTAGQPNTGAVTAETMISPAQLRRLAEVIERWAINDQRVPVSFDLDIMPRHVRDEFENILSDEIGAIIKSKIDESTVH